MANPTDACLVKSTIEGDGVALVQLNRPKKRNALSQVMIDQIASTLKSLDQNSNVRAVVLTGSAPDGPFCGMVLHGSPAKIFFASVS